MWRWSLIGTVFPSEPRSVFLLTSASLVERGEALSRQPPLSSEPGIKWSPLLHTGSGCLLKFSQLEGEQIQRTKGKETRGTRGTRGGHVQVAQLSFYSDFTS